MATSITMPKLGLTMTEGTISKWLKREGDPVAAGETLFTVSTDKLTYDYQSEVTGVLLKICLPENGTIAVGGEVAIVGESGEAAVSSGAPAPAVDVAPAAAPAAELQPATQKAETAAKPAAPAGAPVFVTPKARAFARSRGLDLSLMSACAHGDPPMLVYSDVKAWAQAHTLNATPKARAFAKANGVDLAAVTGHGEPPLIRVRDVENWLRENKVKTTPLAAKMAAELGVDPAALKKAGRVTSADVKKAAGLEEPSAPAPAQKVAPAPAAAAENVKPMTRMRQIIAERMTQSATTVPTVNYQTDVDCTALKALRESLKGAAKVSFNDIIMKACAKVLMEMPMTNCSTDVENKRYIMHDHANIGLAVAVDGGLLVPNVKNVQAKGLKQIAAESAQLVEKARTGTLTPDDMTGGTFTISSLGMFGIRHFTPIINPPESCILGVTMIEDRVVAVGGQIVIRPMSTFCLTADHRAVDGADAARFLQRLKALLENPCLMLL